MMIRLTELLIVIASIAVATLTPANASESLTKIVIAVPGPRNLSYLPIDLISKIGADQAEGAVVTLLPVNGGAIALKQLMSHNADFAVAGLPAAMSARQSGAQVAVIAAVDKSPLFVLMVRSDLRGQVRTASDLMGRVIGVNTSSLSSKTTSQQLAELVLKTAGVPLSHVRVMSAGQSWEDQSAAINSATVDAIMGDEPFASRLRDEGKVFFMLNLGNPSDAASIPGGNFLHAAMETRFDLMERDPDRVAKAVRMVKRSLEWIATHSPEEVADILGIDDAAERKSLVGTLRAYPDLYSRDGAFVPDQMLDTAKFFAAGGEMTVEQSQTLLDGMVVGTWVKGKLEP